MKKVCFTYAMVALLAQYLGELERCGMNYEVEDWPGTGWKVTITGF